MKKIINLVPHFHWDKEWYFTKSESNIALQKNINELFDNFKNTDYKFFTLDGQTSILDDYLEVEPNGLNKLKTNISKGKMIIGPWYTQPDLFSTTGESIVRNLLVGQQTAKEFGARMDIAYVPDSFGQSANMPQIYNQFDLKCHVHWRGIDFRKTNDSSIYNWKAPDGSVIKTLNLSNGYFVLGTYFPYLEINDNNIEVLAKKFLVDIQGSIDSIDSKMKLHDELIVPLGGDQAPIIKQIPEFIKSLNKQSDKYTFVYSNYEDATNKISGENLPVYEGELKWPKVSKIHKTILSSRYDIKKLNRDLEYLIYYKLEPLIALCENLVLKSDLMFLEKSIKKMLECHAHDSLGGCCVDEVTDNIVNNLKLAYKVADSLLTKIFRSITKNMKNNSLVVFNNNLADDGFINVDIFTLKKDFELIHNTEKLNFLVLNQEKIKANISVNLGTLGESTTGINGYFKTTIRLETNKLNKMALALIQINEVEKSLSIRDLNKIETNSFDIQVNDNKINILNKKTNIMIEDAFSFLATKDAGDTYDFSPEGDKQKYVQKLISLKHEFVKQNNMNMLSLEMDYKVNLKGYEEQKINLNIFANDSDILDIKINMKNVNEEIKWIFKCKTNLINQKFAYVNQVFAEIPKLIEIPESKNNIWKNLSLNENPIAIEAVDNYLFLKNKNVKIGVATNGNSEYLINKDNNDIEITLFRSVKYLGKNNLSWRPGRSSGTSDFIFETKNSILKTELNFDLSFFIFEHDVNVWQQTLGRNISSSYYQKQALNHYNRPYDRFLQIINKDFNNGILDKSIIESINKNVTVLNLKTSIMDNKYVLRIVNNTNKKQPINLKLNNSLFKLIGETKLNEKVISEYKNEIGCYQIKTIVLQKE